jgi:tight adherence protein B
MAAINAQQLLNIMIAASVFGLVLSLWLIWLVVWVFRRGARERHVAQRLGLSTQEQQAKNPRVLRLWREGREVTTLVPGAQSRGNRLVAWLQKTANYAGFEAPLGSIVLGFTTLIAAAFMVTLVVSNNVWIAVAGALVTLQISWIAVQQKISKRSSLFERQLVDSMELAARSLRAGHPLTGAFRLISEEIGAPVGQIFAEVCQHQGLGASLDRAMRTAAANCPSTDFKLFATSIVIQLHSGGNLAELMERLAFVMRERMRLSRRVRVLTAQTQFSKRILLAMPFVIFLMLNMLNPRYMYPLYSTTTGQTILLIAALGLMIGAWLMNKLAVLKQ